MRSRLPTARHLMRPCGTAAMRLPTARHLERLWGPSGTAAIRAPTARHLERPCGIRVTSLLTARHLEHPCGISAMSLPTARHLDRPRRLRGIAVSSYAQRVSSEGTCSCRCASAVDACSTCGHIEQWANYRNVKRLLLFVTLLSPLRSTDALKVVCYKLY